MVGITRSRVFFFAEHLPTTSDGLRGVTNPNLWGQVIHWIGLRENLQETMVFTIKYRAFRLKCSHHPIL